MDLKKFFLEQLENEVAANRKVLERVPEGRNTWKPHEKSMELGYLAALVAIMPAWIAMMIDTEFLEFGSDNAKEFSPTAQPATADLLKLLDESAARSRAALERTTEEHLMGRWEFRIQGACVAGGPRYRMIADSALSHLAHHRGQLTVYLRLNEAKVPAIFGPSADEQF